jgi:hypothetical protein
MSPLMGLRAAITTESRLTNPTADNSVDFTAANNVHIMEPHWSPMAEAQAADRVHRKGQTRRVTVTRYIVPKSIETVGGSSLAVWGSKC